MRFKWVFLGLVMVSMASVNYLHSEMADRHRAGSAAANMLLAGVKSAATNTAGLEVPGFKTDNPPEATLGNGSIEAATTAAVQQNEAALTIADHSRKRQKYVIDPNADPLVVNADRAVSDPLKTMDEMVMQTPAGPAGEDEIHECVEGGDEYEQICHKIRKVTIKVMPEIKKEVKWCPGHPGNVSKKRRNDHNQKRWCKPPCKSRIDVIQQRTVEIIQDEWSDGCVGLEALSDQGVCHYVKKSVGGQETHTITGDVVNPEEGNPTTDSEPITRDSWQETYTYKCLKQVEDGCKGLRAKGCVQIASECIEEMGGVCVAWKQSYRCPSAKKAQTRFKTTNPLSPFCLTGDCTNSDYEANGELLDAMSQLAVLKEMQNDARINHLEIFKGQIRKCSKNCAGFRDCCTTGKGWGVSMHLSNCSGEEKELAEWRAKKRCVFVGTYCAEEMLGKCTRKKSSFCCFGTKLAKILNEQGKRQLKIGWGDGKGPDCRGLTPDELSRIDMSEMDLSELYEEVQANFKPKTQDHMAQGIELERIKENMSRMTGKVRAPTVPDQGQHQYVQNWHSQHQQQAGEGIL